MAAAIVSVGVIVLGCQATVPALSPSASGSSPLASIVPGDSAQGCREVQVAAVIHVDARTARRVWASDLANAADMKVAPRAGTQWTLRIQTPSDLFDEQGRLLTFEGEIFRTACLNPGTGVFMIGREDLPAPSRAPN